MRILSSDGFLRAANEKLDIKPVDLNSAKICLIREIENPDINDLAPGNIFVTNEKFNNWNLLCGAYLVVYARDFKDLIDFFSTPEHDKIGVQIFKDLNKFYVSYLDIVNYTETFPKYKGNKEFDIIRVYRTNINPKEIKTEEDLKNVFDKYDLYTLNKRKQI